MTFIAAGLFLFSLSGILLSLIPTNGSHKIIFIKYFQGLILLPLLIGPIEILSEKCITKTLSIVSYTSFSLFQSSDNNVLHNGDMLTSPPSASTLVDMAFPDSSKKEEDIYNELVNLRTTTDSTDTHEQPGEPINADHPHVLLRFRNDEAASSSGFYFFSPSTIAVIGIRTAFAIMINILLSCFISAGFIEEFLKLLVGMHGLRGDSTFFNRFMSQFQEGAFFQFHNSHGASSTKKKRHYLLSSSPQLALSGSSNGKKDLEFAAHGNDATNLEVFGHQNDEDNGINSLTLLTGVVACSLGFATTETLGFVWIFQGNLKQRFLFVLGRVMFSFPLHISCSIMGASRFLAGNTRGFWKRLFKALIPSIALHGSYDAGSLFIHTLSKTQVFDNETKKNIDIIPSYWVNLLTALWCIFIFSISIYSGYYAWVYHKFEATVNHQDESYDYLLPTSENISNENLNTYSKKSWILQNEAGHGYALSGNENIHAPPKNVSSVQVV